MTYVRVEKARYGSVTFNGAVADVFNRDELTVTWEHSQEVAMVFKPGTWKTADMLDDNDNPLASFISSDEQRAQDEWMKNYMAGHAVSPASGAQK